MHKYSQLILFSKLDFMKIMLLQKLCFTVILAVLMMHVSDAQVTSGLLQEFKFNGTYTNQAGGISFASNAGTSFVADRKGNSNSALNINNTGSIATITGLPYGSAARSVSFWVKLNGFDPNTIDMFYSYGHNPLGNPNGGGRTQGATFHFGYGGGNHQVSDNITLNTWTHFVFIYDGTASKIYRNGSLLGTEAISWNTLNNSDLFKIGTGPGNELWFNGAIDDLKIFNRALSANEVSDLYDPAPVQEWSFDGTYASKANTYPFLSNSGTSFTTNRFGQSNKALVINNTGTYVNGGVAGLPSGNSSRTVSFWLSRYQTGTFQEIFVYGSSGANYCFGLNIAANETMMNYNYNFGSVYSPLTSSVIPTGITWAHIAVVYTGDSAKIYRNGLLRVSAAVTTPLATPSGSASLLLGRVLTVASTPFYGAIDDFKIYPKALSQNEISTLYQSESVLPLNLASFTAKLNNNTAQLNWFTSQEINTSHFEVEYSNNAIEFKKIATVAANGNSNSLKSYATNHVINKEPVHYYRLKMVDKDGKFTYSQIIKLKTAGKGSQVEVYPTIVTHKANISISAIENSNASIEVYTLQGQKVKQQSVAVKTGSQTHGLDVSGLASGNYVIKVSTNNYQQSFKLIKQ